MVGERDFLGFVSGVMGVDPSRLTLDADSSAVPEWDSVMHLRLTMEIEGEYHVDIPLEQIPGIRTLRDFFLFVKPPKETPA